MVAASDSDGEIASCSLSLNGSAQRTESNAPYTWGTATPADDPDLMGLASGDYTLTATCSDTDGLSASAEITVSVAAAPEPQSYSLTVNWDAPTEREDGSALSASDIASYEIYYFEVGSSIGSGSVVTVAGHEDQAELTVDQPGEYVIAISCTDTAGYSSDISQEVTVDVQ